MSRLLTIITLALVLSSCRKNDTTMEPATTFTFIADGTAYEWNGAMSTNAVQGSVISKTIESGAPVYTLSAKGTGNFLRFQLQASKLSIRSYSKATTGPSDNYHDQSQIKFNQYYIIKTGDFAQVIITKIETLLATGDRYATGTFTTVMSSDVTATKVNITSGVFKGVRIIE